MIEVAALGELLIDFAEKSVDADGYPTMAAHAGGAPANFLAALNHFGHKGALLGKVGDDAFGKMLLKTLEDAGISTAGIVMDSDVFTTLAFVTFDKSGDRSFSFARKPGADTCLRFDEVKTELIDEAKVFHFGTLSLTDEPVRSTTNACVAYAKAAGKMITCDPNLRLNLWKSAEEAKEQMEWALQQEDVVKISDEEVEFLDHQIQTLTEVVKRDTVVFYNGDRYHLYFAINPTKYKVILNTVNEDGMDVENVYYDNIIHLSIFKGAEEIFSRDFRKPQYEKKVPSQFLTKSILNDMEYEKTDAQGFHVNASLCTPGNASCYRVEHVISFNGKLTTNLLEY